ncbi:MAG: SusC/RagA family TonB-linked outer membrane protein, partial [Bacteroidales bacterium]
MKKLALLFAFLAFCSLNLLLAQTRQITGVITSAQDNSPLPGATIMVKGTTIGAISRPDGAYTISVPQDASVLTFNFVGMKSQEIEIGDRTKIDVALELDAVGIDEVMVVAYNTIKRADFTGSAQIVEGDELKVPGMESIDKSLAGKVSGVRVTSTTGDPGASGEIQIRGIGSINGSTTPLYVVDGIPILTGDFGHYGRNSNILSTLNPEDIENITILKDAAAASLYGSRAANGVVIVTTKQGRSGETKFEFKASNGWSNMASNSFEMMSGPEYHKYEQLAIGNYIKSFYGLLPGGSNYGNADSLAYYQPEIDAYKEAWSATIDSTVNTDWRDVIYRSGKQRDYQLSASGGNEKTRFYLGGGYTDIEGMIMNSDFQRYAGRANISNRATDWLNFSLNQSLSFTQQNGYRDQSDQQQGIGWMQPLGILYSANPTAPKYDENGERYDAAHFSFRGHPEDLLNGEEQFVRTNTYRSLTNGSVDIKFTDYLSFKSTAGLDWVQSENFEYWGPNSVDGESTNGRGEYRVFTNVDLTSSNVLNFNNSFGDHNLSAILGTEVTATTLKWLYSQVINYSNDKLPELGNGQPDDASSYIRHSNLLSYFSNVSYNYANKYYLSGSVRTDGSSRLGVDNRWATFWSASASWRFTGESFLENSNVLTDGKVRFSYGTNGNLPPFWYEHLPLYSFSGGYGENPAIFVDQPGNSELGWEISNNMNVGVDLNLFGRFGLVVEYYDKLSEGLLLDRPITYLTGFESTWQNVGSLKNNGLEVELHTVNIASPGGFTWRTDFTMTTQKSIVNELPG